MRISELISDVLDLVSDTKEQQPVVQIAVIPSDDEDLMRIKQNAGLSDPAEYSNSPDEKYADISASYPAGDDVHHSKQPSDIRADSISMYPNFQARD